MRFLFGHRRCICSISMLVVVMTIVGCKDNSREAAVRELNSTNGKRLSNLYTEFQASHAWRGPKDETEFKEYIKNLPEPKMEILGFTPSTVDDLFVSDRDNEPFRVRYKVRGGFTASDPVVFEEKGVEGKRLVHFTAMGEQMVDSDAAYSELWDSKSAPSDFRGGDRTPMDAVELGETLGTEAVEGN